MYQELLPQFRPLKIKFTYRKVPFFIGLFQRFGLLHEFGEIIKIKEYKKNIFTTDGKESLIARMAGGVSNGEVTYLALGSGTTTPIAGDALLETETFRKLLTQRIAGALILTVKLFITSIEGNATYKEMGLFGDAATAVANSGTLFTHLAINETKTYGQSATIEYIITAS